MKTLKAFSIIFLLGMASTITACIHDSDAGSGVSQAEFDALVARVEALESSSLSPRDTLYSPATAPAASKGRFKSAMADWVDIGTRLECLPADQFLPDWCRVINTEGYYFALPLGLGETYPMQAGRIYFDQVGCTGNPHMYYNDVPPDANTQGFVTGYYPAGFGNVPKAIYMFPVGNSIKTNISMMSYVDAPQSTCVNFTTALDSYFELQPNDEMVSGVSNQNYGQLAMQP